LSENPLASKWLERLARYGPLVFWIGVIFYFSSSFGSFSQTSRFIRPLLEFLFPGATPVELSTYHGYIRKLGHFTGYGILGALTARAFSSSSLTLLSRYWIPASLAIVLLVASMDEWNQSFSSLRTGTIYDVFIDLAGGTTALLIGYFAIGRRKGENA